MTPQERVRALVAAAREVTEKDSQVGKRVRAHWLETTGLSPEGIELALENSLEVSPSEAEIEQLIASVPTSKRAWVLLSANVFVGAHRALALALAGSERVLVRVSRRDPVFVAALFEACPGLFEITSELAPAHGDVFWAYGKKDTLRTVQASLPAGVQFLGHGPGAGAALVELSDATPKEMQTQAQGLVLDTVLFEQRGCLSPRGVVVTGSTDEVNRFAECVVAELTSIGKRVPRGELSLDEQADLVRFCDTLTYVGKVFDTEPGIVALSQSTSLSALTPVGRAIHIQHVEEPILPLARIGHVLTSVGFFGSETLRSQLLRALPKVRVTALGKMQRPPFDGPVDLRQR